MLLLLSLEAFHREVVDAPEGCGNVGCQKSPHGHVS